MATGKFDCPGCGMELQAQAKAAFSPEVLTIAYKLQPGRKMGVADFCKSVEALARSLELTAGHLGAKVMVALEDVKVTDGEVSASVSVTEIAKGI